VVLNDPGQSEIEPELRKIDRVQVAIEKIFIPENVDVYLYAHDYTTILAATLEIVSKLTSKERAVVFIDPWGYKEIKVQDIVRLMENGRTEVLLFLPTSFMYRFAAKALSEDEFPGGAALRVFLKDLFGKDQPDLSAPLPFIESLLQKFRLLPSIRYVDKFTIERGSGNYFCVFFFTNHRQGLKKMVTAKWRIDEKEGRGFVLPNAQPDLFSGPQHSGYPEALRSELGRNNGMTNEQLELFGLERGYLAKHSAEILKQCKAEGILEIESLDGKPVNGMYLDNPERRVLIKLK
jgi:hypothetical protein